MRRMTGQRGRNGHLNSLKMPMVTIPQWHGLGAGVELESLQLCPRISISSMRLRESCLACGHTRTLGTMNAPSWIPSGGTHLFTCLVGLGCDNIPSCIMTLCLLHILCRI